MPVDWGWLALREPADAAARAPELVEELRSHLSGHRGLSVHDLGSGTGSMARWLAGRLAGPQRWVLHDRDADLLRRAAATPPTAAADGAPVIVETRRRDVTRLDPAELAGASLVTASALLDVLTADELERVVAACHRAGCPALLALSVTGRVELTPGDPLDPTVSEAFNDHQRRTTAAGRLLGPDAVGVAAAAFARHGVVVEDRPSPWRLGAGQASLVAQWFSGWLAAACEQRPELRAATRSYADRRRAQATAGELSVTVHHRDLLAWPG
jgi:SAM-dependent methyltransferase